MKVNRFAWLIAAACILLTAPAPKAATTTILTVQPNGPFDNVTVFSTIQAAITQAGINIAKDPTSINSISVKAGTYTGTITPISGVSIIGESTAGTFLTGSGTLINLNNVTGVTIRNFTFKNTSVGISVVSGGTIRITNNVFPLGSAATAIQVQNSPSTSIINNTFYLNGTAISTDSDILITNDIFSKNTKAIAATKPLTLASYNYYFANGTIGITPDAHSIPNTQTVASDPLFVDPANLDFHLQASSPCIGIGNPDSIYRNSFNSSSDMGAYGGPNSDNTITIPTVTGLSSSITSPLAPPTTITLTWNPTGNNSVTAYRVYYGRSFGNYTGTQASEGASPIKVLGATTTSQTLTFVSPLPPPVTALPAPVVTSTALNQAIQLNWAAVPGATEYHIFHSSSSFDAATLPAAFDTVDATTTSFTIPGLTNGTPVFFAVMAVAQTRIFATVTSVIDPNLPSAPGTANESSFAAPTIQNVGTPVAGPISSVLQDSPEVIVAVPNVKGEGCFIATAAFGFYSAPQVQVLRDFRDRYLLTNAPGRAFVAWYYHYGPIGAHFINVHPWLKPPVRLALLPLVVGSFLLIHTPPLAKIAIIMLLVVVSVLLFLRNQRKMLVHSGGTR